MENNELYSFGDLPMSELMHSGEEPAEATLNDTPVSDLKHSGVKGMKWGIRRYQNKDGTLTPAGKKHYAKLESELEKLSGAKANTTQKERAASLEKARQAKIDKQKAAEERAKKLEQDKLSVKEMTDAEIQSKIDRIKLENSLKDLMKEPAKDVGAQKANRGKDFTNKFKDDLVDKLAKNVAADLVAQTIKAVGAYGINKALNSALNSDGKEDSAYVFSNNKRKG